MCWLIQVVWGTPVVGVVKNISFNNKFARLPGDSETHPGTEWHNITGPLSIKPGSSK